MDINALFYLLSFFISLFLAYYVYQKNPSNSLNRTFVLFSVVVAYWGITGFGFRLSDSIKTATLWLRLGGLWPLTYGFLLHFILILTDRSSLLNKKIIYGVLYVPPLLFSILDTTTNLVTGYPVMENWGWTINAPQFSFFYYASVAWQVIMGVTTLGLCITHWLDTTSFKKKQQIKFVFLGLSIPFIFSVIVETLEVVLGIPLPEVIMPGFAVGSVFFGYAILKYELFILDPKTVTDGIVSLISEFLFLINLEGILEMASESALRGLRYPKEELLGEKVDLLFEKEQDIYLFKKKGLITLQENPLSDYETCLKTKTGALIPVSLSASGIQDKNGNNVGIICVARDITRRKETEQALFKSGKAFTLLFEAIPDPVYVWKQQDEESIILEQVNRAAIEQTEGKINNFIGKDLNTFYEYNQNIPDRIKDTFKTGMIIREPGTYRSSISGEKKWLLVDYVKISTDRVLIVTKDLTDKIEIERELKREKK
ncbi:MAG: PAS domain S-box protein, partial [Candidatus Thorarchaeota archaeon]